MRTDHVVFLIGAKETGSVDGNRETCPHLDVRASHGDLACLHCGSHFPISQLFPIDCNMLSVIGKEFRRQHRRCEKGNKRHDVIDKFLSPGSCRQKDQGYEENAP